MMKGRMLVDGEDVFVKYGIFVEQYGYKALIQQPAFKKLDSTEWPEDDGEEVDLTAPVLDTKSLSMQFCMTDKMKAESFFHALSQGSYHTFKFADLQREYVLRMTSNGSMSSNIRLGNLTLTFSQDDCRIPSSPPMDEGVSGVRQHGYEIDGIDMSRFGAYVLDGTDDSIRKAANAKSNLSVSTQDRNGIVYDGKYMFFKSKDITLNLLINAAGIESFWDRWDALFASLMQPEHRIFYFDKDVAEYECYYKSNSVSRFDILGNGHVWCEFSVVLTFTSGRPQPMMALLSTEDGIIVFTEDGERAIDMSQSRKTAV